MSESSGSALAVAGLAGAVTLFAFDLVFSVALLAVSYLSRVAVRRLSQEGGERLAFLEDLKVPQSTNRMAAQAARQASLLGGSVLVGLSAKVLGWVHPWILGVVCGIVVGVLLIETFAARLLAQRDPRFALRAAAPFLRAAHFVLFPVVSPLAGLLRRLSPDGGSEVAEAEEDQEEELEALIEVGERDGILEAGEGKMVRSIVDLGETRVREIMTPRTDIDGVPATCTVKEARHVLVGTAHTRLPVFRSTIDNVVGILHVRDLVRAWEEDREDAPVTAYARPAFFVPETQSVSDLLAQMRERTHLALVVDEYGGIAGLVTLEDLLEEIVGDIRDEHDREEALVQPEADGWWLVSGLAHVEQIEEVFDLEVGERDFDTVGGLVVSALGRVPEPGENFETRGLRVEVVDADRRRVYRIRVRKAEAREEGP